MSNNKKRKIEDWATNIYQQLYDPLLIVQPIHNDIHQLRDLFRKHSFRTSIVQSPRQALSIYMDAVPQENNDLTILFGIHPQQEALESVYCQWKESYWLHLFRQQLHLPNDNNQEESSETTIQRLQQQALQHNPKLTMDQLDREYQRIRYRNATLANALLQRFAIQYQCEITDVYLKHSHLPQYQRITIYLYDPDIDERKPPRFCIQPSVSTLIQQGPQVVARNMVDSFWKHLLRKGYYSTTREQMDQELFKYFYSGICKDPNIPIRLIANFEPNYPLSFYLVGPAGCGKSSLVRHFSAALNAAIEEHVDPELQVRFVKQNLNKPMDVLELELDLRPNNNDLSVMSLIQSRRLTLSQSKPGLVVVGLEEMAENRDDANPNQEDVAKLIAQRFAGRKGEFKNATKEPRNSDTRGIANDATIVPIFTSNYDLQDSTRDILHTIRMFSNLTVVAVKGLSGDDRRAFALSYLEQRIRDGCQGCERLKLELDMPVADGDLRPLVRQLRMIAYYATKMFQGRIDSSSMIEISVTEKDRKCLIESRSLDQKLLLHLSEFHNLFPGCLETGLDERVEAIYDDVTDGIGIFCHAKATELLFLIELWLTRTLAPAVIVSTDQSRINALIGIIEGINKVSVIKSVDADEYKMMKSLYDDVNSPNLRDDILALGRGTLVAVELHCRTPNAQMRIREIIEDTPSRTAFSSERSALQKDGLFFGVYVSGAITPELLSRASLVI